MNICSHVFTQRLINQLMARNWALSGELRGHHRGAEMDIVITQHLYVGVCQVLLDKILDSFWCHDKKPVGLGDRGV